MGSHLINHKESVSQKIVAHPSLNPLMMFPRNSFWIAREPEPSEEEVHEEDEQSPEQNEGSKDPEEEPQPAS